MERFKVKRIRWKFGKEEKKVIAEKLFELANIGAGVLLFTQHISEKRFPTGLVVVNAIIVAVLYFVSFWILKRR